VSLSYSVHSNIRDYEVYIQQSPDFLHDLALIKNACFIIDENVWKFYSNSLLKELPDADIVILPINEDRKNLDSVQELYAQLVTRPAKRNLTLVSIGGGILQDITGFTASTLYRGIHWIFVPTTLLSQADSCIGSKTSLNYGGYKNIVGTFYPPEQVHIFPLFLKTQQDVDFYSGYGEVIKLHLLGGENLYHELSKSQSLILSRQPEALLHAIQASLNVKLGYISGDEFDTGRRNLLNYGHDFGHALESTSNFEVPHGQAVIFGMMVANKVARNRGLLDKALESEITQNLLLPSLKIRPPREALDPEKIVSAMKNDKKRTGDLLALIMLQTSYDFLHVNDLTPHEVIISIDEAQKTLGHF
jgi:3-dehydroquinate synthase